ncbi:MAG: TrmH family RNA methyltransferase [Acutalibacteraceae bacterium]|jgi:TrmH family RNA methyltransferase
MERITSRDNPQVRALRRLLEEPKYRRQSGLFALEGARLCADAVDSGVPIETALITGRAAAAYPDVARRLAESGARMLEISEDLARRIGDTASPQGLFCIAKGVDKTAGSGTIDKNGTYLALENVQDPSNLGAIIRTAEALGIDGLLTSPGCCDRYNPKVLRASMGGVFRLPLIESADLPHTLDELQKRGMTAYACVVDADACPVQEMRFEAGAIAVIGNEGNGLTAEIRAVCARRITIRMAGRAESLNASVAAALIAWEMTKNRT